ncbi:hypothetical protein UR09_02895 [Candidatus Nitromaritima sp. SCGC AAA799-A02]|nr:hypothetical protein UR09_02895 [Candidatus Nitromaritima sp. SCGC AAA799-A02]
MYGMKFPKNYGGFMNRFRIAPESENGDDQPKLFYLPKPGNGIRVVVLECPFCGGEPEANCALSEYWISCRSCKSSGKMESTFKNALDGWNMRKGEIQYEQ